MNGNTDIVVLTRWFDTICSYSKLHGDIKTIYRGCDYTTPSVRSSDMIMRVPFTISHYDAHFIPARQNVNPHTTNLAECIKKAVARKSSKTCRERRLY